MHDRRPLQRRRLRTYRMTWTAIGEEPSRPSRHLCIHPRCVTALVPHHCMKDAWRSEACSSRTWLSQRQMLTQSVCRTSQLLADQEPVRPSRLEHLRKDSAFASVSLPLLLPWRRFGLHAMTQHHCCTYSSPSATNASHGVHVRL